MSLYRVYDGATNELLEADSPHEAAAMMFGPTYDWDEIPIDASALAVFRQQQTHMTPAC